MISNYFGRLRATAGQSVLLTSSWGFGCLLVLGLFLGSAINQLIEIAVRADAKLMPPRLGLPQWLWSASAAGVAYFAAAVPAYRFAQSRRRNALYGALLLTASTLALTFPLMGLAFIVLLMFEGLGGPWIILVTDFLGSCVQAFRVYGLPSFLWISLCSAAVAWLVPLHGPSEPTAMCIGEAMLRVF